MEDHIKRMVLAIKDNRKDLRKARKQCNCIEESYCLGYDAAMMFALWQLGIDYREAERLIEEDVKR